MYIGVGTLVLILVIVVIVLLVEARLTARTMTRDAGWPPRSRREPPCTPNPNHRPTPRS